MWARVHKIDRVKPLAKGGAIVFVEDERNAGHMSRVPSLTVLIAIARVLNAKRLLEAKYNGIGEVRYATNANPPSFLSEAIARSGAILCDRDGETIKAPAAPASVASTIDMAFAEFAYYTRGNVAATDIIGALRVLEERRRKTPLKKDDNAVVYWTSVFELAALAGELSRGRGGRWIDTKELPVPYAIKFTEGGVATPTKLAQQIVEGGDPIESMATDVT